VLDKKLRRSDIIKAEISLENVEKTNKMKEEMLTKEKILL
jgi:hypothetical protein